jgi:flagellin-like protein
MKKVTKNIMKKEKKGLSPVIATVLLIILVIVIALIVFLWVRGMTQEAITKFDNRNVELVCADVEFEASYSSPGLYITNFGNVPIFGMDVKVIENRQHTTLDLRDNPNWDTVGLNQGGIFSDDGLDLGPGVEEIILIPVLLGESNSGRKTYVCNEKQYGYDLQI